MRWIRSPARNIVHKTRRWEGVLTENLPFRAGESGTGDGCLQDEQNLPLRHWVVTDKGYSEMLQTTTLGKRNSLFKGKVSKKIKCKEIPGYWFSGIEDGTTVWRDHHSGFFGGLVGGPVPIGQGYCPLLL